MKLEKNFNLNRNSWEKFVSANAGDGGLLQSWGWGEFQQSYGRKIWRLAWMDGTEIRAVALVVRQPLPGGFNYFYLPRGPIIEAKACLAVGQTTGLKPQIFANVLSGLKELAETEKAIFIRMDPAWEEADVLAANKLRFGGQVQPRSTLVLDLTEAAENLLKAMKPKTRYNIKVAQKHGIKIATGAKPQEDLGEFMALMKQTAKRDNIAAHSENYYRRMLERPEITLVFARAEGQAVAAAIMAFYGDWCYYLHGASAYEAREKMAPYLLQWEMIKEAQNRGCKYYDFFGADPDRWPGVTRFKVGFAPQRPLTQYVGAYDLIVNPLLYFFYKLIRRS
ncbi:MAG: peptidoglycan bridge formation glycyltransferase FemA/FemB family protein [Patescibacteria group bacterium]|jgi:lipid II:glycine glycyltransferase (peptidoglycan interpeptide bridge formation enzyme)